MSSPAVTKCLEGLQLSDHVPSPAHSTTLDFDALYRDHHQQLTRFARRFISDPEGAEDVVQQSFLNAYRARANFDGRGSAKSWLYTITRNTALMVLRSRRRKPADAAEDLDIHSSVDGVLDGWSPAAAADPERNLNRSRVRSAVDAAIGDLAAVDQKLVHLRLEQGLSTREVAAAAGLSEGAVKTRLYRARGALQAALAPSCHAMA